MGTRGLYGFYYKGRYYLVYNHWDSYPNGLGMKLVAELVDWFKAGKDIDGLKESLSKIKFVSDCGDGNSPWIKRGAPTEEDIEALKPWTDLTVSNQTDQEWYCLLRKTQGSLTKVLDCGYMLLREGYNCPKDWDDIFIEWVYVVDLDNAEFIAYEGSEEVCRSPIDKVSETIFLKMH